MPLLPAKRTVAVARWLAIESSEVLVPVRGLKHIGQHLHRTVSGSYIHHHLREDLREELAIMALDARKAAVVKTIGLTARKIKGKVACLALPPCRPRRTFSSMW